MSLNLTKNVPLNLTKAAPGLVNIRIGLGWDASRTPNSKPIDVDVTVLVTDAQKRMINRGNYEGLISYNNPTNNFSGCTYGGDNKVGAVDDEEGIQEYVDFDTRLADPEARHLVICASIYAGSIRKHFFSNIRNAYISLTNIETNTEVARLNLADLGGVETTGAVFGILSLENGEWIFNSSDVITRTGLSGLLALYGLPGVKQEIE